MSREKQKQEESLAKAYEAFKSGGGEAPRIFKMASVGVKVVNEGKKVILSLEEEDRDGETVIIDGVQIRDRENGIPMIDSHRMNDSVTVNGLGAIRNLRKEIIDGKAALVGDPDFAPTPNGKIAEILYMGSNGGKPYFTNVSIGFIVKVYEPATGKILESEVFECSLVTIGANYGARFASKSIAEVEAKANDIEKKLARYAQIQPAFKEVGKTFLSDRFCNLIGYEKNGDLLIDINNVYDLVEAKFTEVIAQNEEAPREAVKQQEAPDEQPASPKVSEDAIAKAFYDAILSKIPN